MKVRISKRIYGTYLEITYNGSQYQSIALESIEAAKKIKEELEKYIEKTFDITI